MRKLGARIVVPALLIFIIGVTISTVLIDRVSEKATMQAAYEYMEQTAEETLQSLVAWSGERKREVGSWSDRNIIQVSTQDTYMGACARKSVPAYFAKIMKNSPYILAISLMDTQGNMKCSSDDKALAGFVRPDSDYFQRALRGEISISAVLKDTAFGKPVFMVAAPVKVKDSMAGVVVGVVDISAFTGDFIDSLDMGDSGYVFIADWAGTICSRPHGAKVFPGALSELPFGSTILDSMNGMTTYNDHGEDCIVSFCTDTQEGWRVVVGERAKDLNYASIRIIQISIISTAIVVLVTGLFLLLVVRSIVRPIGHIVRIVELVAEGKLIEAQHYIMQIRERYPSRRDETGVLFASISKMTDSLISLVRQVQQSSTDVVATATQMADTSQEQERRAAGFGAATTQVLTASRSISNTSQQLSRTMEQVRDVSAEAAGLADSGHAALAGMEDTMHRLQGGSSAFSEKLAVIHENAVAINGVITTITKVADQTNLLSLNAAIEAEKAGEHGMGFSVVAHEIRRLADQTAVATLDIERMIKEMQASVSSGVDEMKRLSEQVADGEQTVQKTARQLRQAIELIEKLAPQFDSVTDGARNQTEAAQQISQALGDLREDAVRTSNSLRQFKAATELLEHSAQGLQAEVQRFKV